MAAPLAELLAASRAKRSSLKRAVFSRTSCASASCRDIALLPSLSRFSLKTSAIIVCPLGSLAPEKRSCQTSANSPHPCSVATGIRQHWLAYFPATLLSASLTQRRFGRLPRVDWSSYFIASHLTTHISQREPTILACRRSNSSGTAVHFGKRLNLVQTPIGNW